MEFEQIIHRLDWLDSEHRKDKKKMSALEERLASLETDLKVASKKIKEMNASLTRSSSAAARMEQMEDVLDQQRSEINKHINEVEKKWAGLQQEADKRYQLQTAGVEKTVLRKNREAINEIKRELKARSEEDVQRTRLLTEWESRMQAMVDASQEVDRAQKASAESQRQESKRLTDLQGEVSATRKRLDEVREKTDLFTDSIRRIESRLNELLAGEAERRQSQTSFLEQQARLQVERDHTWKEWEERFEILHQQTGTMETQLQEWNLAQRAVKRAQETYEEITQKFERRINEIAEIQRLAEDRFRQEWVTFKSDEQKRWTSYSLSQEEQNRETRSDVEKLGDRTTALEDLTQTQQDILQQTKEANEQLLQALLAQIHELLNAYERIMGSSK